MLNKQLADCVEKHSLTAGTVAETVGCSRAAVGHWKTGHNPVSEKYCGKVTDFIGRHEWCGTDGPVMVKPPEPAPISQCDKKQAERFLTILDEETEKFTFQTFDDSGRKRKSLTRVLHGTLDEYWAQLVELNNKGAGIYVTVNETDFSGRKEENIVQIRSIWIEDDDGLGVKLPTSPHIIIESSPGHHHKYILTDSTNLDEFKPVQQILVDQYGSCPGAKDLPRVLRVPGFLHLKDPDNPFPVRIINESGEQPLTWDEVKKLFPALEQVSSDPFKDIPSCHSRTDIAGHTKAILTGENYNNSMCSLSSSLAAQGLDRGRIIAMLEGIMDGCRDSIKDQRWQDRRDYIPAYAKSALKKYSVPKPSELTTENWPDPESIPGATFKTAGTDYPYEYLPDVIKKAAAEVARFAKVPEVSPGVVGVATVATALGKKAIVVERKGLTHFASIFFVLLAPSGERKTPPFKYMTKPLEDWVEELMEGYSDMCAEVKSGNKVLDSAMGLITANAKKPGADLDALKKSMTTLEGQRQAKPIYPSIFTTNTTEERLFQKMYDRGGTFAVMSGEGRKVFDIIMGQYTGGGQTGDSIYLAGLSGDTITRDRVGGDQGPEESLIRNPCLTACVMVQPDKYMEAARVKALRESGALARIWPVKLPSLVGSRIEEAGEVGLNEMALEPYNNMIKQLLEAERDEPVRVYLSETATEARRICHNEFELLMAEGQMFNDVTDITSKAVSQITKIAMILHIADNPDVLNQDSTMLGLRCWKRAEAIGRYHLAESINVQRSAGDSDVHRVAEWIKGQQEVTARMVMRLGPRPRIDRATKATEVLETLVDLHHLRTEGENNNRVYVVNPKCRQCRRGMG